MNEPNCNTNNCDVVPADSGLITPQPYWYCRTCKVEVDPDKTIKIDKDFTELSSVELVENPCAPRDKSWNSPTWEVREQGLGKQIRHIENVGKDTVYLGTSPLTGFPITPGTIFAFPNNTYGPLQTVVQVDDPNLKITYEETN